MVMIHMKSTICYPAYTTPLKLFCFDLGFGSTHLAVFPEKIGSY